jgi:hypothetical protein
VNLLNFPLFNVFRYLDLEFSTNFNARGPNFNRFQRFLALPRGSFSAKYNGLVYPEGYRLIKAAYFLYILSIS